MRQQLLPHLRAQLEEQRLAFVRIAAEHKAEVATLTAENERLKAEKEVLLTQLFGRAKPPINRIRAMIEARSKHE